MLFMTASAFATTVPTFALTYSTNQLQYVLPSGTIFNGTIVTTGDVRFWVSDPNASEIVNLGIIDNDASFSFIAQQNGTYTLNFENDLPNTVQVTFSYTTNPPIPGSNDSTGLSNTYLIITIIIAVSAATLLILFERRQSKIKTSNNKQELSNSTHK